MSATLKYQPITNSRTIDRLLFAGAVFVGCLTILATFLHASDGDLHFFFTSDTLYLPSIYRDIFIDGGHLSDWWLNAAPNFFPDMGLYFLLHWLLDSFIVTSYVYPMVQFAMISLLFRSICRESGMVIGDRHITLGVLLLSLVVITGLWGADFGFAFQLLVNSWHVGAFVNTLLCTWLLLRVFSGQSKWRLVPLALAIMAGATSDKLFWVMFSIPATVSCGLLARQVSVRWLAVTSAVVIATFTWAADLALKSLDDAWPLMIERPYQYMAFERIGFSWGKFLDMLREYLTAHFLTAFLFALGLLVMCWAIVRGWLVLRLWIRAAAGTDPRPSLVYWMMAMFFPFVLLVPVASGSFDGLDSLRYDFAVFILAPLVAGVGLAQWAGRRSRLLVVSVTCLIGLPSLWVCISSGDEYHLIAHFKPERVVTMDRMAKEFHLTNGIANYWDAKLITMFSEEDVFVMPVFPDLGVYLHVNREAMFYSSAGKQQDPLMFDFVIMDRDLNNENMTRMLGGETSIRARDGIEVLTTEPWSFDPATRRPRGAGR